MADDGRKRPRITEAELAEALQKLVQRTTKLTSDEAEQTGMNDFDAWIYFDGPAPESLQPVLDALHAPPREDHALEVRASPRS